MTRSPIELSWTAKNRWDCGVDVKSALNTLFRTHNTNNSKEQNTTIRPHNANNSNKGLLNSSQLQKPIVVNGRFWEEIQKYCFWIGHIYFWIGHIYFWIRLICFWIRHICFWIGHILCKLPCSTISVVEKCQRRKGLVSSKYPTARENTYIATIVGWMFNRFTPVVRFRLLKNVNVEKVL